MRLAAAQARFDHEVGIMSYAAPSQAATIEASYRDIPGIQAVRRIDLPQMNRLERFTARRARAALVPLIPLFDWVYLHSVWDPISKAGADVAQKFAKPYFILLNGMLDPWSLAQRSLKKKLALALGYRRMLDRAAALHLGNFQEQELIRPLKLKSPGVIIPNGVNLEEMQPRPSGGTFRKLFPQVGAGPYVLFLGRLHHKKGLDILASAFAILAKEDKTVRLVVAGPDDGARADFEKRIIAAKIADRVHLVGPLYGESKLAAYVDAACFCLPSRQEGFSVAVLEALALGAPVVITEGVHFPEIQSAGAGKVVDLDGPAVAIALKQIISDPLARERMGDAGQQLIAAKYTWQKVAEQSLTAFEQLCVRRRENLGTNRVQV
jgi:glycosyltransferase involved in cell wall biosynthesis